MFLYFLIMFAGFGGFMLTFHIHHKKIMQESMVCPMNFHCDSVIYSNYSKILGIPVELLGMAYYALVALSYGVFLAMPYWAHSALVLTVLGVSAIAFLFSIYLTAVQTFVLREWCTWCLTSAGLCIIIFSLALVGFV